MWCLIKQEAFSVGKESVLVDKTQCMYVCVRFFFNLFFLFFSSFCFSCGWNFIISFVCSACHFIFLSIFLQFCALGCSSIVMNHMCLYSMMYALHIVKILLFFFHIRINGDMTYVSVCFRMAKSCLWILCLNVSERYCDADFVFFFFFFTHSYCLGLHILSLLLLRLWNTCKRNLNCNKAKK